MNIASNFNKEKTVLILFFFSFHLSQFSMKVAPSQLISIAVKSLSCFFQENGNESINSLLCRVYNATNLCCTKNYFYAKPNFLQFPVYCQAPFMPSGISSLSYRKIVNCWDCLCLNLVYKPLLCFGSHKYLHRVKIYDQSMVSTLMQRLSFACICYVQSYKHMTKQ